MTNKTEIVIRFQETAAGWRTSRLKHFFVYALVSQRVPSLAVRPLIRAPIKTHDTKNTGPATWSHLYSFSDGSEGFSHPNIPRHDEAEFCFVFLAGDSCLKGFWPVSLVWSSCDCYFSLSTVNKLSTNSVAFDIFWWKSFFLRRLYLSTELLILNGCFNFARKDLKPSSTTEHFQSF